MQHHTPLRIDQVAGKATITIEQTAQAPRTRADGRLRCRPPGRASHPEARTPIACAGSRASRMAGGPLMQGHIHKRTARPKAARRPLAGTSSSTLGFDSDGRRRQKWHGGFRTRREAEVARAKLVNDMHTGSYVLPARLTLTEWVRDSWLPMTEARVKLSTFHSYRRNLETHVLPALGTKPLQQLTPPMFNALYAKLAMATDGRRPLSAKTISYIHATVHKVLEDAVDAGLVARNVADRAKPPRPARRSTNGIQAWDPTELARFLDHVRGTRLAAIWRLAAMTGMRRGEILGLRWHDIDLDAARLSVRHAVVAVAYATIESTPKSHNARVIDLDPETVEGLRLHRASSRMRA